MINYKNLLLLFTISASGLVTNAQAADFKSNIVNPNLFNEQVFGLLPNNLLFYSGEQDGKFVAGYYKSSDFLGWINNKFQPLANYNASQPKKIESVIIAPDKNTIVLSTVEDVGQFISNSADGNNWRTVRPVSTTKFDTLVVANNNAQILAYGKKDLSYFTSKNTHSWYQWALPSGCINNDFCTYENHYLNTSQNKYVLIQSTMTNDVRTNKLYTSDDQQYWSIESVPFGDSKIVKAFNGKFNTVFIHAIDTAGNDKLWLSPDVDGWVDFDLPKGSIVTDVLVHNKNRIDLLLYYPYSGKLPVTDYVTLDTESRSFNIMHTFSGKVSNLKLVDEKIYITGNFKINDEEKASLLASGNL